MKGKEAVLLYSSDLIATQVPDNRRLKAFTKIELEPGQTKRIEFEIKASELAFVNWEGKWTLEKGEFILSVGSQKIKVECEETRIYPEANPI